VQRHQDFIQHKNDVAALGDDDITTSPPDFDDLSAFIA
jgi:hypothetical protein